eukprot:TRINITY_DN2757_c0_g1_i1.p1 TRINITY_DN2757_c0_g1~~TRINITY_DN2757_c0_g1_i1.p1  ORF type:complete len:274 (-),score=18.50 TRINITY_DN2757_c0_g1_i1:171-992(-)
MDKHVYARWWNTVFLPAVRARHRGAKCALIMDNSSTHDVAQQADYVEILFLPPNVTAIYQPMDAGVIEALKRRYKRRLLAVLVRWFPLPSRLQPPPTAPDPLPERSPTPPPTTPPGILPPSPPSPPVGFRTENEALWVPPTTDVLQEYGAARLAGLGAMDDAADAAAQTNLLAALLPPPDQGPRPQRNCGLAGRGQAHLMDAATFVFEEWEKVTQESIVHCWVKSTVFTCCYECVCCVIACRVSPGFYKRGRRRGRGASSATRDISWTGGSGG